MYLLTPRIRDYAWGSHTALAQLSGRCAPTATPEAEMWMGSHEEAPSEVVVDGVRTTLDRLIATDPVACLGEATVAQFQRRLPFLLKILAPEQALSIQCHPTREEALTAPTGTYGDTWPKPEALLTVSDFEVFVGTKPMNEIRWMADELDCAEFAKMVHGVGEGGVRELLQAILQADAVSQAELSEAVATACAGQVHPHLAAVDRIAGQFPGDPGLAVLLTMQHHVIPPGRYLMVPAGVLHAYVRGVTVEILANSDNIVRAGLTPKQINIHELLRIVDVDRQVVLEAPEADTRVHSYPVDVPYFQLHQVMPGQDAVDLPARHKPRIVLSLGGTITLDDGEQSLVLGPAQSCFIPAHIDRVACRGDGTAYVATTGLVG